MSNTDNLSKLYDEVVSAINDTQPWIEDKFPNLKDKFTAPDESLIFILAAECKRFMDEGAQNKGIIQDSATYLQVRAFRHYMAAIGFFLKLGSLSDPTLITDCVAGIGLQFGYGKGCTASAYHSDCLLAAREEDSVNGLAGVEAKRKKKEPRDKIIKDLASEIKETSKVKHTDSSLNDEVMMRLATGHGIKVSSKTVGRTLNPKKQTTKK